MHARELKAALKAKGWSDTQLAAATDVHITLVRRYLRGEVSIGAKNAIKIARALALPVEQVLYGSTPAAK